MGKDESVTLGYTLFQELAFGQVLVFSGQSFKKAKSIYIDFHTPNKVALRIFFNYEKKQLERYTKKDKDWINGETTQNMEPSPAAVPKAGEAFKIAIFCDENRYQIWLQDKPFCHYSYHIPIAEVKRIEIGSSGLAKVTQFDHRQAFPFPWPMLQYDEPDLEFSHEVPAPFKRNQLMSITGTTLGDEKGNFTIFFRHGRNGRDQLNFKVCFEKKKVFRSYMEDACSYEKAKTDGPFPFKFGEQFKLAVGFLKDRFIIGVNGERIPDFKYPDKTTFGHLTSYKIRSSEKLRVIISNIDHSELKSEDCVDYDFGEISCEKKPKNVREPVDKYGDTGDDDSNVEDDDEDLSCTEEDDHVLPTSSSSGSFGF